MIDINEGNTNNFLVHGVFGVIISIGLFFVHFLIGLPVLLISMALFTTTNGILIDIEKKSCKRYAGILNYKLGDWKPLGKIEAVKLVLSIERSKTNQRYILGDRGVSRSMTYDIVLTNDLKEKMLLYEFLKYRDALKALKAIEKAFNIVGQDKIAEKLKENASQIRR